MKDPALYESISAQFKNYPVKVSLQRRKNTGFVAHWHEHVEILYILSGNYRITCGNRSYDLMEKDIVFINSKEIHFSEQSLTSQFWCIHITPAFFSDIHFEGVEIQNLIRSDAHLIALTEQLLQEHQEQKEGSDLSVKGLAYMIMAHLSRNYQRKSADRGKNEEMQLERLRCIFVYITKHYAQQLTTASLAEAFYLNEQYFCRLFKKTTGQSVMGYINRLRIEKAILFLENTSENITDIALMVGFNDLNYFCRLFKRFMNISPAEYRRLYRKSES